MRVGMIVRVRVLPIPDPFVISTSNPELLQLACKEGWPGVVRSVDHGEKRAEVELSYEIGQRKMVRATLPFDCFEQVLPAGATVLTRPALEQLSEELESISNDCATMAELLDRIAKKGPEQ